MNSKRNYYPLIKKAVIPVAGLGTRFLPLSKALPKELFPLVDKPAIQYIIEEAQASGIKEIIFVNRLDKKDSFIKYFKRAPELEKLLKARKKNDLYQELKNLRKITDNLSFSYALQKEPLGDGHAILQAKKLTKKEPCAVLFGDDIVESKTPCLAQLIKVFNKYQAPIIALARLPKDKLFSYGVVEAEKIGPRLYKIKRIVEKPSPGKAPSNLAIAGKYIINPQIFSALKNDPEKGKGEIKLASAFNEIIKKGFTVYGYEFDGKWLECGNKLAYLKSNIYLSLKHPQFKKELKKFLKEEKF